MTDFLRTAQNTNTTISRLEKCTRFYLYDGTFMHRVLVFPMFMCVVTSFHIFMNKIIPQTNL